jgi:hypothetical protein
MAASKLEAAADPERLEAHAAPVRGRRHRACAQLHLWAADRRDPTALIGTLDRLAPGSAILALDSVRRAL